MRIPGYDIVERLSAGPGVETLRARRQADGAAVLLKVLAQEYPSAAQVARLRREFALLRRIDSEAVARPLALETFGHRLVLVLEDRGAAPLRRQLVRRRLPLGEALELFIALAGAVRDVHDAGLIHKDINPASILWDGGSGRVQLLDFGLASEFKREQAPALGANALEGTLAYMAPEQSGRMNRPVDYRSDYYALGVVFFEVLAGRPPFEARRPLDLIHCHIAVLPPRLDQLQPQVPAPLADVVARLLAKNVDERYQSAEGLLADLNECLSQWRRQGRVDPFPLGRHERIGALRVADKLYGREPQLAQLLTACERVAAGGVELWLVSGPAGIGKSTLVGELQRLVLARKGRFAVGKFDPLRREQPYAAVLDALQGLVRQLLTEPERELARWRERLRAAGASALLDAVPPLEQLVGSQPPPESQADKGSLHDALRAFIVACASAEQPLVLFLDDLQWADPASLALIRQLLEAPRPLRLLLIGACREDESDAHEPWRQALEALRRGVTPPSELRLEGLTAAAIAQMVAETFHCEQPQAAALAELLLAKTLGNPFFIRQFLTVLVEGGMIRFDSEGGRWSWDLALIERVPITDNVVELLAKRFTRLTPATQEVLQAAASLGGAFSLRLLARVLGVAETAVAAALQEAVREGLVLALNDAHGAGEFQFLHDRVRQVAYSLLDERRRLACHHAAGNVLLEAMDEAEPDERLFDAVGHLNKALPLLADDEARQRLAELNLRAGRQAGAAAAHHTALALFEAGLAALGDDGWRSAPELSQALATEAAQMAFRIGAVGRMEQLCERILAHARDPLAEAPAQELRVDLHLSRQQLDAALEAGLAYLERLGLSIPARPSAAWLLAERTRTELALRRRPLEAVTKLPPMTDPWASVAMRMLGKLLMPAYQSRPQLMPVLTCHQIRLALKFGSHPVLSRAYASYGLYLAGGVGQVRRGHRFGRLALALAAQPQARAGRGHTELIVHFLIDVWVEDHRTLLTRMIDGHRAAAEGGDLQAAAMLAQCIVYLALFMGMPLPEFEELAERYCRAIARTGLESALAMANGYRQVRHNLMHAEVPDRLEGPYVQERSALSEYIERGSLTALFSLLNSKLELAYLFRDYTAAARHADAARPYRGTVIGALSTVRFHFFDALTRLALLPGLPATGRLSAWRGARRAERLLARHARMAPASFAALHRLVVAERLRVQGRVGAALAAYQRAIEAARRCDNLFHEALANERAALFCLGLGWVQPARGYLRDAYYCWGRYGAAAKQRQLQALHPECVGDAAAPEPGAASAAGAPAEALDLAAVLQAGQAISQEIRLPDLLVKLMRTVTAAAGAQVGFLLLERNGEWRIEARYDAGSQHMEVLRSRPLVENGTPQLAQTVVNYVACSRQPVLLANAAREGEFRHDPYVALRQSRSILCLPLLNRWQLRGILYLENDLAEGAFAEQRLAVLQLLSAQAAVSIENARLYAELELQIRARTRDLEEKNRLLAQLGLQAAEGVAHGELEQGLRRLAEQAAALAAGEGDAAALERDCRRLLRLLEDARPAVGEDAASAG